MATGKKVWRRKAVQKRVLAAGREPGREGQVCGVMPGPFRRFYCSAAVLDRSPAARWSNPGSS